MKLKDLIVIALVLLSVIFLTVDHARGAEQQTLFLWTSNNLVGSIEDFRLQISGTSTFATIVKEVTVTETMALAYPIPPGYTLQDCGVEVPVPGDGVQTYWARVRAEAQSGSAWSDWSEAISHEWNFLVAPGDLIVVSLQGSSAEIRVYERLADGSKKRRLFYYGGGS